MLSSLLNLNQSESEPEPEPEQSQTNLFHIDVAGGPITNMEPRELYQRFDRVLVICFKNGITDVDRSILFNKTLSTEDLQEYSKYLTIQTANLTMVKNRQHKRNALILQRSELQKFNSDNINLENDEIVICLFELNTSTAKTYIELYTNDNNVEKLFQSKVLYNYFNCDSYGYPLKQKISKIAHDLVETDHWTSEFKCNMNITQSFNERIFKNKKNYIANFSNNPQDKKILAEIEKIISDNRGQDYLQMIHHTTNTNTKYTDSASIPNASSQYRYRIDNYTDLTRKQINDIFSNTYDQKELYHIFISLLISKKYCHYVINNYFVLKKMKYIINKFKPIFKYIFGYAWQFMYIEECIKKTRTTGQDRYVFDINTASQLPVFPYCVEDPHLNPYFTLLVNKESLNSMNNFHGLPMLKNYDSYGIDNIHGFNKKFNIFSTGNIEHNIFDGLKCNEYGEWDNFAISGSVIPSCVSKKNPLFDLVCDPNKSETENWTRYFNEYYTTSDIDIMCNSQSVFKFLDNTANLIKVVKQNLVKFHPMIEHVAHTVNVNCVRNALVIVSPYYIKHYTEFDFDHIKNNFEDTTFRQHIYDVYIAHKKEHNVVQKNQHPVTNGTPLSLYNDYYTPIKLDELRIILGTYKEYNTAYFPDHVKCVFLNEFLPPNEQVPAEENYVVLKISDGIKYKLSSPHIPHDIEVFPTRYKEFFSIVSKFHLPCVRAYYNGQTVKMLPSFITALMTFTNIDYKYFASIKSPDQIINKYRMRGFGVLLNKNEKIYITQKTSSCEKMSKIITINPRRRVSVNAFYGPKEINHAIYKPGKYLLNTPDNQYNQLGDLEHVISVTDLEEYYKEKYNYTQSTIDFLKFKTVNETGTIEPLKKWVIDAGYDMLH